MKQHADGQTLVNSDLKRIRVSVKGPCNSEVEIDSTCSETIVVSTESDGSVMIVAERSVESDSNRPTKFWQISGVIVTIVVALYGLLR